MPFQSNLSPGLYRRMQYADYVRYRAYRRYIQNYRILQNYENNNRNSNEISFKNLFNNTQVRINNSELFCSICQSDVGINTEIVRELKCSHVYHLNCIDTWFLIKNECPLCKKII